MSLDRMMILQIQREKIAEVNDWIKERQGSAAMRERRERADDMRERYHRKKQPHQKEEPA